MSRGNTSSPMASLEAVFKTATIDAYEGQDIMVMDVTNTFIHANMPPKKDDK